MTIQNIFYLLGSIYMVMGILLMIGLGIAVIYIVKIVISIKQKVDEKLASIKEVAEHPEILARGIGSLMMNAAFFGFQKIFRKNS